jgi:hypothetical protein
VEPSTSQSSPEESLATEQSDDEEISGLVAKRFSKASALGNIFWPDMGNISISKSAGSCEVGLLGSPTMKINSPMQTPWHKPGLEKVMLEHPGHYYRDDDARLGCTKGVLDMAQRSPALEYAVASFASLANSIQIDQLTKPFALVYYYTAVQLVLKLLDTEISVKSGDWVLLLAAVLQLATVDV